MGRMPISEPKTPPPSAFAHHHHTSHNHNHSLSSGHISTSSPLSKYNTSPVPRDDCRSPDSPMSDVERVIGSDYAQLTNTDVRSFGWRDVTVTVKDRNTKQPRNLLTQINGCVKAGELMAVMGPSGSGKSTLLNVLAHRFASIPKATVHAEMFINGTDIPADSFRRISAYVEQDDALVGSLTIKETLNFAARLSLPSTITKTERIQRINSLIAAFGLQQQSNQLVGTPIRKGISGGQKRRLSVAAQLITSPKVIFLDEPTSGLDSAAAFEVVSFVKEIAQRHNLIVVASIHQPSTSTFAMFNKLLLLSQGCAAYSGPVSEIQNYFDQCGFPIPLYMNPAEFIIDFVNTDFATDKSEVEQQLSMVHTAWAKSQLAGVTTLELTEEMARGAIESDYAALPGDKSATWHAILLALIHRSIVKAHRDVIVYGIRVAMYIGLAILMGTVWLRLTPEQQNIQSFVNAIFFGGAFMSFMAVAYIPAYLEDRSLYIKERANGLYGPTLFITANFAVGLPYLFIISLLFSTIAYWLSNFRPDPTAFFTWIMWLFLDLVAAESLVVLIASLAPIFVIALAATAFANGLWMCTGGFLVPPQQLNAFWYYVFHFIDYQSYVFRGMMVNEFGYRDYSCPRNADGSCAGCMYTSDLAPQCMISGNAVLTSYGYGRDRAGKWVVILLGIMLSYRLLGWLVLKLSRK